MRNYREGPSHHRRRARPRRRASHRHGPNSAARRAAPPRRYEPLEPRMLLDAGAVISEFMAVNSSTLADENITRTQEEALARIKECLKKSAEGQKFEDLAKEYSDGPSGPEGGDLGEFGKRMMDPAFEEAAFECEVGKVTDVVETPFGYHIIYRYK